MLATCVLINLQTTAIETGMQNLGLAVLVLQLALQQPDADLAKIPVVAALLMTSLPLFIATPVYLLRERIIKKVGKIIVVSSTNDTCSLSTVSLLSLSI